MKAATYVAGETKLSFPLEATDKFDGIRCLKVGGRAVSASFKPIGNDFIRNWIEKHCPDGFDGEIMVVGREFNDLSGDVRRKDGEPDFRYHVFDYVQKQLSRGYRDRCGDLQEWFCAHAVDRVVLELPATVNNEEELIAYEEGALARGREGVMVRSASSPYKCGRSTLKEGYLIKIKRFVDDEADILGMEEEMENQNAAEQDAFGRTKRSKDSAGLVPKGTMGKLLVRDCKTGVEFEIGTGFTAAQRQEFWDNPKAVVGRMVKYKHQSHGAKSGGKPRIPVFLTFREDWDMSNE
jgi:DNA ligase-1